MGSLLAASLTPFLLPSRSAIDTYSTLFKPSTRMLKARTPYIVDHIRIALCLAEASGRTGAITIDHPRQLNARGDTNPERSGRRQ
jgi:hypothetical protein